MNFGFNWQPASDAAIILTLVDDVNFQQITFVKYPIKKASIFEFLDREKIFPRRH